MVNRIQPVSGDTSPGIVKAGGRQPVSTPFSSVLNTEIQKSQHLRFSAHATQRLTDRHIAISRSDETNIARAVDKAAAKGARETLLLMDKLALVVSVPNRTVITAMSQHELNDTVFTNIDSAVVVPQGTAATSAAGAAG